MTQMPDSIFDRIAQLLPADSREHFYRRMTHLRDLSPDDDMLQIAEAMGFLALVTRQIPGEIATERIKLETLFENALSALKVAYDSSAAYHRDLEHRLEKLPGEVALSFNAENVSSLLFESIRQNFCESGLPAVSEALAMQAQELRRTSNEIANAFDTFSHPDQGAMSRLHRALNSMQADLTNATDHIRTITRCLAKDLQRTIALFSLVALVLGFLLGAQWGRQH
jgi:hypothetical protein